MKALWTSAAAAALATFMAAGAAHAQDTGTTGGTTAGADNFPCTIQVIGTAPGGMTAGGETGTAGGAAADGGTAGGTTTGDAAAGATVGTTGDTAAGGDADQILGAGGETHTINVVPGMRVMISAGPGTAGATAGVAGGTTTAGATAGRISTGDAMTLMSGNGCTVTVAPTS